MTNPTATAEDNLAKEPVPNVATRLKLIRHCLIQLRLPGGHAFRWSDP